MRHLVSLLGEDLISIFGQGVDLFAQVVVKTQLYEGVFCALLFFQCWDESSLDGARVVDGSLGDFVV